MKQFFLFALWLSTATLSADDPYGSLKTLPSDDNSGGGPNSPYESFSNLPNASDERHETLQNEYSVPQNQGQ